MPKQYIMGAKKAIVTKRTKKAKTSLCYLNRQQHQKQYYTELGHPIGQRATMMDWVYERRKNFANPNPMNPKLVFQRREFGEHINLVKPLHPTRDLTNNHQDT